MAKTKAKKKKSGAASKTKSKVKKALKVKKLPRAELRKFKALILRERERIAGGLSHITENTLKKSLRDSSGDLSGYSFHMADVASDDYDRDFSLDRATEDQKLLYLVDEALKRVEDGTYGICNICGKPIPKKRLKAMPYAEACIHCLENKQNSE